MPIMRLADPETGHKLAVRLLGGPWWLRPKDRYVDGKELRAEVSLRLVTKPLLRYSFLVCRWITPLDSLLASTKMEKR
jgi:hypothetical protein